MWPGPEMGDSCDSCPKRVSVLACLLAQRLLGYHRPRRGESSVQVEDKGSNF